MFLLSQDDFFLDTDPSKSPIRYPAKERARLFGNDPNSPLYKDRLAKHRRTIVDKLVSVGQRFIDSIVAAMSCFPPQLRYLITELNKALSDEKDVPTQEITLISTDLV